MYQITFVYRNVIAKSMSTCRPISNIDMKNNADVTPMPGQCPKQILAAMQPTVELERASSLIG